MTNFEFNTYNDYLKSVEEKSRIINEAEIGFKVGLKKSYIKLTKDILTNHMISKLEKIKAQSTDDEIVKLELDRKLINESLDNIIDGLESEKESILAALTASVGDKKRVTNVRKATGKIFTTIEKNENEKDENKKEIVKENETYFVYIGEPGGSTSYQKVLKQAEDMLLAKRFLEINQEIKNTVENRRTQEKEFWEKLKQLREVQHKEYVEFNFSEELHLLNKINGTNIRWIEELKEDEYYNFLADDEEDYELYIESIEKIQILLKEIEEIRNSYN